MAGCAATVVAGTLRGWDTLVLANNLIEAVVLPSKGADIYSLVDLESGVDVLFKTPWGLQPPDATPREGSAGVAFLENYEGGWQELLPNTNDPCTVAGVDLPFHGEVALLPWSVSVEIGPDEACVRLSVECTLMSLRLERVMRCRGGERRLVLEERVTNLEDRSVRFTWGHHLVLGAPLVAAGARLSVPARTLVTPAEAWEDSARLEPGQRSGWPHARLRDGGEVDLSVLPGPESGSHDDVYLTDLDAGWARLWNPDLRLGFEVGFDPAVHRWLVSWQPFGGAHTLPLAGSYGLGLEPWTAGGNLQHAIDTGQALMLPPLSSLSTRLTASLHHADLTN